MRSNKKKKTPLIYKRLLPLTILITVLFMGIGYATVTSTYLTINGDITSKNPTGVFIYNVEYVKKNENDVSDSIVETYVDATLSTTIKLDNNESDYETYRIYVKNNSTDSYMYFGITYNESYFQIPNENIIFEEKTSGEESISKGFIIEGKEEKVFQVTFKYKDGYKPNQLNVLSSIINFKFNPITSKIVFDANGGTITNTNNPDWIGEGEEVYKIKAVGETYGTLPNATREGYKFEGWMSQMYPGYYQLKYLESSNKTMIQTDVKGNNSNLSFYIKYEWSKLPSSGMYANLFTAYQSENHITTRIIQYGPNTTYFNLNTKAANSNKLDLERKINTIYEETLRPNDSNSYIYVSGNNSVIGSRVSATAHNNNITIFNGVSDPNIKLYNFKIYDNNILIRDYVPCLSTSNLKGLCDITRNEFYYNSEQSNFLYDNLENSINSDEIIEFEQKLLAKWKANEYELTLDPNGGNISTTTVKIKYDQAYGDLPKPTRKGYAFAGWNDGNKIISNNDLFKYTSDKTLTATWKIIVALDANGGSVSETTKEYSSISDTYGTLPTPTRNGYKFLGWTRKDYTEIAYVENTGTDYIETDVKGDNNNLSFEIQYEWLRLPAEGTYTNVFTSYESESHITTRIIQYGPQTTYFNINSKAEQSTPLEKERIINEIYTEKLEPTDENTFTYTSGEDTQTATRKSAINQSSNIYLLISNFTRVYYFKIYDNGELIKDYIPALNAYGEYGLFDKVKKEFITNGGSSRIIGGSEKNIIESTDVSSDDEVTYSHTLYAKWEKIN